MAEHSVVLAYGTQSCTLTWRQGAPAKEFGAQLAEAVKGITGLTSLHGLEMCVDPARQQRITPRDLFERRFEDARVLIFRTGELAAKQVADVGAEQRRAPPANDVQHTAAEADAGAPKTKAAATSPAADGQQPADGQQSCAAKGRERRPKPPRFQKKGGSQLQWMRLMQTDKDPAGLQGASSSRRVPLAEVQEHDSATDIWMVLGGRVFNVTPYMEYHPGGKGEMMKGAGGDATALFTKVHPWVSLDMIDRLQVGILDSRGAEEGS